MFRFIKKMFFNRINNFVTYKSVKYKSIELCFNDK